MEQIGRYQILGELGRGAMGVVFRALDPSIGREVAIKTIRFSEFANGDERVKQRERLFREARSAGILSHPGIVTIYDMAEQDGMAYIAMEFVPGFTLEQILSSKEPVEPDRLFSILKQTAGSLDYAHQKGIVHRDIKPANIIINDSGAAKIADFGIAKISAADQLTQTGLIVGTPNYMAPEQIQGKPVTGLADQYSLTVLAYEMLTGDKPFVAEHLTTLVYQIVCEPPPPANRLNPTLGPQIEAVLQKGLSKKPEDRYPNCTALVEALAAACAANPNWKSLGRGASLNLPTMAETSAPKAEPVPPPRPAPNLPPPRVRDEPERKGIRLIPILATLLIGCAVAAAYYYLQQPVVPVSVPPAVPVAEAKKPELKIEEPPPAEPEPAPAEQTAPPVQQPPPTLKAQPQRPRYDPAPVEFPVRSQPTGATVMLDGAPETACVTPCQLKAVAGEHTISLNLAGYKTLLRPVKVTGEPVVLPVITLAQAVGVLMLQSQPDGATITIDDKPWPGVTPAQIRLPPGQYKFTLQKGDLKSVHTVEIRDGDFRRISIALAQP